MTPATGVCYPEYTNRQAQHISPKNQEYPNFQDLAYDLSILQKSRVLSLFFSKSFKCWLAAEQIVTQSVCPCNGVRGSENPPLQTTWTIGAGAQGQVSLLVCLLPPLSRWMVGRALNGWRLGSSLTRQSSQCSTKLKGIIICCWYTLVVSYNSPTHRPHTLERLRGVS